MTKYVVSGFILAWCIVTVPVNAQDDDPMPLPEPAAVKIDFLRDIKPILIESCSECHAAGKKKSKYQMDTRELAIKGGAEGTAIVPGDSAHSRFIHVLIGTDEWIERMPSEGDLLTSDQVALMRAWIDQDVPWAGGELIIEGATSEGEADAGPAQAKVVGMSPDWVVEATHQEGPLATWVNIPPIGNSGASPTRALIQPNHNVGGTYNLLWTADKQFKDGTLTVKLKSLSGEEDQGGGLMWRAQDKDNYYVARFNPLEDNFRFYRVKDGKREAIEGAEYKVEPTQWTTLTIEQHGKKFTGYLDGKKLIEATDATFTEAGGIGYWTKADAATAFTEIQVDAP